MWLRGKQLHSMPLSMMTKIVVGLVVASFIGLPAIVAYMSDSGSSLNQRQVELLEGNYDKSVGLGNELLISSDQIAGTIISVIYSRHHSIFDDEADAMVLRCAPPSQLGDVPIGIFFQIVNKNPSTIVAGLKRVIDRGELDLDQDELKIYAISIIENVPDWYRKGVRCRVLEADIRDD